jgi:hypothetical protein
MSLEVITRDVPLVESGQSTRVRSGVALTPQRTPVSVPRLAACAPVEAQLPTNVTVSQVGFLKVYEIQPSNTLSHLSAKRCEYGVRDARRP